MYNQRPWKSGPVICEKCQCHGHATECQYDPIVDEEKSSLDIYGTYSGGGICINCSVSIYIYMCVSWDDNSRNTEIRYLCLYYSHIIEKSKML